jgi:hypothetical protein
MEPLSELDITPPREQGYIGEVELFRFESKSEPGKYHYAWISLTDGETACSCMGFEVHGHCWHSKELHGE